MPVCTAILPQELRLRLDKSEAARQRLREAVTAGLAANAQLRKDSEVCGALRRDVQRVYLTRTSPSRQALAAELEKRQRDCAAAEKRAAEFAAVAKRASGALQAAEQGRVRAEAALEKEARPPAAVACFAAISDSLPTRAARQRASAAALHARVSELSRTAGTAAQLSARVAVLEQSLAAVREAALGVGALPGAPPPVRSAGPLCEGMQSALSGPEPQRRGGDEPSRQQEGSKRGGARAEAVMESGEQQARKRRRAGVDANAIAKRATGEAAPPPPHEEPGDAADVQRRPQPPPVLTEPSLPMQPQRAPAPAPEVPPVSSAPAPVRPAAQPVASRRVMPPKAAKQPAPPHVLAPAPVDLARTGAMPLRPQGGGTAPTRAAGHRGDVAAEPESLAVLCERATTQVAVHNVALQAASTSTQSEAATGLCAAAAMRSLLPTALLQGVVSALRSSKEDSGVHAAVSALVLNLDAALATACASGARALSVRMLGAGIPGGFADAVAGELQGGLLECVRDQGPAGTALAAALGAVHLLRARNQAARARVLLLDLLLLGAPGSRALRDAALGAVVAWPQAFEATTPGDPLTAAVAATAGALLAGATMLLESWTGIDTDAAAAAIAAQLAKVDASSDALHSSVRGLEVLSRHSGVEWAVQRVVGPQFSTPLGDGCGSRLRAMAGPLLACCASAEPDEASTHAMWTLLEQHLQPGRPSVHDGGYWAAECVAEVAARTDTAPPPALQLWWFALTSQQRQAAPARVARALRAVGLTP